MKRTLSLLLAAILLLGTLSACGAGTATNSASTDNSTTSQDGAIIIKVGHAESASSPDNLFFLKLEELFEKATDGRYDMQIYADGILGGERDTFEGTQMGTIDMTLVSSGYIATSAPALSCLDLPYIFKNREHALECLHGDIGNDLMKEIESTGVKGLCWTETGFRNLWTVDGPVNSADDVKGLKIRTQEIPSILSYFRALGADATAMSWSDAYTGLQQGVIDGLEVSNALSWTLNVYEAAKYYAITEHLYSTCPVVMSTKKWNSMSEEDQQILLDCIEQATTYEEDLAQQMNNDCLQNLIDAGVEVTYPDKTPFFEAGAAVYDEYRPVCGDYIDRIQAAYHE